MTNQDSDDFYKNTARYQTIFVLSGVILFIIFLIKFILPFIGVNLDSNPISNLHWSYYVLSFVGALFYVCVLLRRPVGKFNEWRAASTAATRVAQAIIYTIIILNLYGSTIKIGVQTEMAVDGAIVALFIGLYVKLFEKSITGIAHKINGVVSPEAKELDKLWSKFDTIKEDVNQSYDQLNRICVKEPEKYRKDVELFIKQIEIDTEILKDLSNSLHERRLGDANNYVLEMESRIRIFKLKYELP